MRGVLADINIAAHQQALLSIWLSDYWRDLWNGLGFAVESFPNLGLAHDSSDALIWRTCQRERLVLITANRNKRGSDSLEATMRAENRPDSLPIVTIADANRVLKNRAYAELVSERLLERLIDIDAFLGAGRIYVP
jgi:hypothetical protein